MRIATYNVRWFDHLFDDAGRLLDDDGPSARLGVSRARQAAAIGAVLGAINADAVMVIEAPDTRKGGRDGLLALETFAARSNLRARRALTGFPSGTQQEISLLFDPDALAARHDPQGGGQEDPPRFDALFLHDIEGDGRLAPIAWARPPLEVAVRTASGAHMRLIGVHAKSKAPHGARDAAQAVRIGVENRRKQLAQCLWLRARVERHLAAGDALVVLGDFNDGPGQDAIEAQFGRSGVEIVLGEGTATRLLDPHARVGRSRRGPPPRSARFRDPSGVPGVWLDAMLDFAMISPDLCAKAPRWRIWHPHDDPACAADPALRAALLDASDHFPVTLDLSP